MPKVKETFAKLRSTVLQAAELIETHINVSLPEQAAYESNSENIQSILSEEEAYRLSSLLYVAAIRILHSHQDLSCSNFSALDIWHSACQLHARLKSFCPLAITDALPAPEAISASTLKDIWDQLSDPQLSSHWHDESALGYVYQHFATPIRKESLKRLQTANKELSQRSLVSFTQLYTPNWVIDFLLQNTLVSQWLHRSKADKFNFCISSTGSDPSAHARELSLTDPACGSGHFLLRAFDLLLGLYEHEGWPRQEAVHSILSCNIAGADVDPVGLFVSALALLLKCVRLDANADASFSRLAYVQELPINGSPANLLGSLSQIWTKDLNHLLSQRYRVVVTNPPYIGRKLLDRSLKKQLKVHYPESHQDLCAAFLRRSIDLLAPDGRLGLIGQASLLYLPTYESLRKSLIEKAHVVAVVETGPGVFPLQGGEKVDSALLVLQMTKSPSKSCFIDLSESKAKENDLIDVLKSSDQEAQGRAFWKDQLEFRRHRRHSFNYKCPSSVLAIMGAATPLGEIADLRQGLATTDNARFVRRVSDVDANEIGKRWFPYIKGAGSQRWWAPIEYVVDWKDNGQAIKETVAQKYPYLKGKTGWVVKNEEFYFKEGLTFSLVCPGKFAVRRLPAGCIFDVGGSAIFAAPEMLDFLLAYLNSSFIAQVAKLLNPTINYQIGDLKLLPVLDFAEAEIEELAQAGTRCCELTQNIVRAASGGRAERQCRSARCDAKSRSDGAGGEAARELSQLEGRIDHIVTAAAVRQLSGTASDQFELRLWIGCKSH